MPGRVLPPVLGRLTRSFFLHFISPEELPILLGNSLALRRCSSHFSPILILFFRGVLRLIRALPSPFCADGL